MHEDQQDAVALGPNAWLVDEMYDQYREDPDSVSESWREFFADYHHARSPADRHPTVGDAVALVHGGAAGRTCRRRRCRWPPRTAPAAVVACSARVESAEPATPLRGAAARIVANMEASLEVPTATSFRVVPARLLEVNRRILNNQLRRVGRRQGQLHPPHRLTPSCGRCGRCRS